MSSTEVHLSSAAVAAAHDRVRPHVRRTPVLGVAAGDLADAPLVLKLDVLQVTGSFKARGAYNLLLDAGAGEAGVVAASGGNFGLAVAHAARTLGIRADVFVPATSPTAKVERLRGYGAEVHVIEGFYAEALAASEAHVERTGAVRAHAYDQPEVVAGQGTCAKELEAQADGLHTVLVAVGGGGLIAGTAAWLQDRVRIVGVETEGCPTMARAREAGAPVDVEVGGLAASSLGARRLGAHAWAAQRWIDDHVLVPDEAVAEAQRRLWGSCRVVAEPGGATALAAVTSGAYVPEPGERLAVIVCGANTDPSVSAGR